MALTTDHGIAELVSTWAFAPATGPTPAVINDHGTSWIKLESAPGLHDGPESEDNREGRTNVDGEIIYPGFKLGRTFSLKCTVYAENELDMRALLTSIRRGYTFNMDLEGVFTVTPYSGIGGPTWTFGARVLGFHPDEVFNHSDHRKWKWRWGFELVLRMSDTLFYSSATGYV